MHPPLFGMFTPADDDPSSILRSTSESNDWLAAAVGRRANEVGGIDALEQLDDHPLLAEPFDWTEIGDAGRPAVEEVLTTLHEVVGEPGPLWPEFDDEHSVIIDRLLARVAARDPHFVARSSPQRTAAALVWLTTRADTGSGRRSTFSSGSIWRAFGVPDCAGRGRALLVTLGLARNDDGTNPSSRMDTWLADPRFMHSRTRKSLVDQRDELIAMIRGEHAREFAAHPLKLIEDGRLQIAARPVMPRWATRAAASDNRSIVALTLGQDTGSPEVLALSIPDARRLVTMLNIALDAPIKRPAC